MFVVYSYCSCWQILTLVVVCSLSAIGGWLLPAVTIITAYPITRDGLAPRYVKEVGNFPVGQSTGRDGLLLQA